MSHARECLNGGALLALTARCMMHCIVRGKAWMAAPRGKPSAIRREIASSSSGVTSICIMPPPPPPPPASPPIMACMCMCVHVHVNVHVACACCACMCDGATNAHLQHLGVDPKLRHRLGRLQHLLHLGRLHQLPQELGVLEQPLQHGGVLGKRRRQPRGQPAATAAAAAAAAAAEGQRRRSGRGGRGRRRLVQDGRKRLEARQRTGWAEAPCLTQCPTQCLAWCMRRPRGV